ncbi:MAG: hypothetical protein WA322_00870 [Pseudolabrys sp.]|jgi:hypothetical protein
MEQAQEMQSVSVKGQPQDWAKLIRKLRWIGMEDEACRLQMAVRSLPPDQRGTVSAGPFSTD